MQYAVVIEKAGDNYSAYVPDLPGCIATGATVAEIEVQIRDAIQFHIEGLRDDGAEVPEAISMIGVVDILSGPNDASVTARPRNLIDVSYIAEPSEFRRLQVA